MRFEKGEKKISAKGGFVRVKKDHGTRFSICVIAVFDYVDGVNVNGLCQQGGLLSVTSSPVLKQ